MLLDDLARGPRRERVAFRGEIRAGHCLGDRGRMIDVHRRHDHRQANALQATAYRRACGTGRDRHGARRGSAHSVDSENVADSIDDRDGRIDAARLRLGNGLRDDFLNIGNRQARRRTTAVAAASGGGIGAGGRRNGIAAGARCDQQRQRTRKNSLTQAPRPAPHRLLLHDLGASTVTVGCGW